MCSLSVDLLPSGAGDMRRAYRDMREANWIGTDKYFHARGNYEAAQRGPGGRWAAAVISDGRELVQRITRRGNQDEAADQEANRWGRNGRNPNVYRPRGLPSKY
ncbi:serum amyloid A-2 protein-like isoform X2 [Brachyhypopomus gauderio]|uniref:serum amyloid A-2 protein-like isoform X2 n=1 Tax=Brachyhypopomus gauderio TaxID=698409 RepID=UPI00404111B5